MEVILFVGLQASGKSTYYQTHFADTHLRINLDMLRTRRRENALFSACLETGQRCVIDNTNPTPADRAGYVQQAKAKHFRVVAYFFDVPFETCIGRNARRSGKRCVPEAGLRATAKKILPPLRNEGFDEIFQVHQDGRMEKIWATDEVQ